jgi:hypothetical protein
LTILRTVLLCKIQEHIRMSVTATEYEKVKFLEKLAYDCGFKLDINYSKNQLCLVPREEELPIYNRTASLAIGSVEELISFLRGWKTHEDYLFYIRACSASGIVRKEQDWRNRNLVNTIKGNSDV